MPDFDSPVVQALVERARSPLDGGDLRADLAIAMAEPGLSNHDHGQLLFATVVASQGQIPPEEAAEIIEEAIVLLKEGGDEDTLASVLGVSAALHAMVGDMQICLERCLDFTSLTRGELSANLSIRSIVNFGVALLSLGAYELASELFVEGLTRGLAEEDPTPIMVSALNLALSLSREVLVTPGSTELTPSHLESLELIDRALATLTTLETASETPDFVRAVRSHVAQLRGDFDGAVEAWGSLDWLANDPTDSFARYFCLIEAPVALHQNDLDRALGLVNRSLEAFTSRDLVPLRQVEALQLRSVIHERMGQAQAALADARHAAELALRDTSRLADVVVAQINQRALLEQSQQTLIDQTTELTEQAMVDELSQVGNRRAYEMAIDEIQAGPACTIGAVVCDIDDFKTINDRFGHGVGDQVIARAGAILSSVSRSDDRAFRYGGDEFVLLVPADSIAGGLRLAERVQRDFAAESWSDLGLAEPVTLSIGVWTGLSRLIDEVVAAADGQLYEAKRAGRNCIRPVPYSQGHE